MEERLGRGGYYINDARIAEKMQELQSAGVTLEDIAIHFHCAKATVYRVLKRHAPDRPYKKKSILNDPAIIKQAIALRKEFLTHREIAQVLECSPQSISNVLKKHDPKYKRYQRIDGYNIRPRQGRGRRHDT